MGMHVSGFCIATTFLAGEYESEAFWLDNEDSVTLKIDSNQVIDIKNEEDYNKIIERTIKLSFSNDAFTDWFEDSGDYSALQDYYDRLSVHGWPQIKDIIILADTENEYRWERSFSWVIIHLNPINIITGEMIPQKIEKEGEIITTPTSMEYLNTLASSLGAFKAIGKDIEDSDEDEDDLDEYEEDIGKDEKQEPTYGIHKGLESSDISMTLEEFEKNFEYQEEKRGSRDYPKGLYIKSYIGESPNVVVPSKVGKKPVVKVFDLGDRSDIVSVDIPETVEIKTGLFGSFTKCPGLFSTGEDVIISGRMIYLENKSPVLVIPDGVKEILATNNPVEDPYCWKSEKDNEIIEEIVFPDGLKKIHGGFESCKNLKKIVFPDSLEEVCGFKNCVSLEEIILPKRLKRVGNMAFSGCTSLKSISISPEIECGLGAFEGCPANEGCFTIINDILYGVNLYEAYSFLIPEHVKAISSYAFFKPGYIAEEVILKDTICEIDEDAFGIYGIKRFALVNHTNGKTIFETEKFGSGKRELSEVDRFQKVCKLICKRKFADLGKYGTVYIEAITEE